MLYQKYLTFAEQTGTKLKHRIEVVLLSNSDANDICTEYHYLHRARTGGRQLSHGVLFDGWLLGCIIYASPTFHTKRGLIPPLNQNEVIELARMWLHDDMPRNSESCSIGISLRRIRNDWNKKYLILPKAVISFADLEASHEGTIYKATNFYDCGFAPMARHADVGQHYSRTKEGWHAGHYKYNPVKFAAKRTSKTKRIYLYLWDDIKGVTLHRTNQAGNLIYDTTLSISSGQNELN